MSIVVQCSGSPEVPGQSSEPLGKPQVPSLKPRVGGRVSYLASRISDQCGWRGLSLEEARRPLAASAAVAPNLLVELADPLVESVDLLLGFLAGALDFGAGDLGLTAQIVGTRL